MLPGGLYNDQIELHVEVGLRLGREEISVAQVTGAGVASHKGVELPVHMAAEWNEASSMIGCHAAMFRHTFTTHIRRSPFGSCRVRLWRGPKSVYPNDFEQVTTMSASQEEESFAHRKVELPPQVSSHLTHVFVPHDASVLIWKESASNGDPRTRVPKIVHELSDEANNLAILANTIVSGSIRKAKWRLRGNNRVKENEKYRQRYKVARKNESAQQREQRLAKRRKKYAMKRAHITSDDSESGISSTSSSNLSTSTTSYIPSVQSSLSQSSGSSNGTGSVESEMELPSVDETGTVQNQSAYVYELHVDTKLLKCCTHFMAPTEDVDENALVLNIDKVTNKAIVSNGETSNTDEVN